MAEFDSSLIVPYGKPMRQARYPSDSAPPGLIQKPKRRRDLKTNSLAIMTAALLCAASLPGTVSAATTSPFSISPMVGGVSFAGKEHLETSPVFGLRAGYNFTKNLELEALYDYAKLRNSRNGSESDFNRFGGDLLWNFRPNEKFVPNLAAGYAGVQLPPGTKGAFDLGGGFKYFVTEDVAWRGDVRGIFYNNKFKDYVVEYTTGLYIPFGGAPAVAKLPEPPAPPQSVPRTMPQAQPTLNLTVPTPPPPVVVAAPEVALAASPTSIKKGERSILSWKSKRADNCEMRPDLGDVAVNGSMTVTPAVDTVYSLTCTGKGGTGAANAAVMVAQPTKAEKRFCNQPAVLMINFDTDKWNVKPQYHAELKSVGDFLNEFPEAYGEISGHTDGTASADHNQRLSERRAQAVRDYIVKNFHIDPKRLTAKGYGKSRPIANNKTAVGRAKNRRIEANLVCRKKEAAPAVTPAPAVPQKESSLGKKPLALATAKGSAPLDGGVTPGSRQGEPEKLFVPQVAAPGAALPAAQRKGETEAVLLPSAPTTAVAEGAVPPPLPSAQRKKEIESSYVDRPVEAAPQGAAAPAAIPAAQLAPQPAPLLEGEPAPGEVAAAKLPPELPSAQRAKEVAAPAANTPAAPEPTLPAVAAPEVPLLVPVPEAESVSSALRKQEPVPPAPDEEPFVLKGAPSTPTPEGKIALTGVTIDKNGLSLFTNGKVSDFRVITMVEPYSLVIELIGAVNGMGAQGAAVDKFDLTNVRFREFPDYLQITLDAGREEIIPYRTFKIDTGLRINIKPRSTHHIGP